MKNYQYSSKLSNQFICLQNNIKKNKDEQSLRGYLQETGKLISEHHLGIILGLFHNDTLLQLFENTKQIYLQKKQKSILEHLYPIFQIMVDCYLDYDQRYKKVFKGFKTKWSDKCDLKKVIQKQAYSFYRERKQLIKQFIQIKNSAQQLFAKGTKLVEYLQNRIRNVNVYSTFDQVVINWLNQEVRLYLKIILKQRSMPDVGYCCRQSFQFSDVAKDIQYPNHYYVGMTFFDQTIKQSIEYKNEFQEVKKTVIEYLNCKGGYIFYGVLKDIHMRKKGVFKGMDLNQKQRQQFLFHILNDLVLKIFPTDEQNQDQTEEEEKQRLETYRQKKESELKKQVKHTLIHSLSKYLEVEFVSMFDCNLFDVRNYKGTNRYIVRIKVSMGKAAELYFTLNQKELPIAYTGGNNPLPMMDYYSELYKKLKDSIDKKLQERKPLDHTFCLQSLRYSE